MILAEIPLHLSLNMKLKLLEIKYTEYLKAQFFNIRIAQIAEWHVNSNCKGNNAFNLTYSNFIEKLSKNKKPQKIKTAKEIKEHFAKKLRG